MAENSFFLNILNLIISIGILIEAYKKNNIILFFYIFVFQVLVVGQAINISSNLQNSNYVMYYNNLITDVGHLYASYMLLMMLLIIWIFVHLFSTKKDYLYLIKEKYTLNINNKSFLLGYYLIHVCLVILGFIILINTIGGIGVIFEESRPGNLAHGVTMCLLLITFGLYPLFFKLICGIKKNILDVCLFIATFLILLAFSRMLVCIHLIMFYMVYFYIKRCRMNNQVPKLFMIFFALFSIMVLYGAYRHSLSFEVYSLEDFIDIDSENSNSLLSIDLFYRIGIEGMTGFSGAISEMISSGNFFNMDFGLSTLLNTIISLFPSNIRDYFVDEKIIIDKLYWYSGHSVVSGALENMIVHFSIFSVIIYPILFSSITLYFDYLSKKNNDLMKISLNMIIVSFGVMLIRGTLTFMLFYIIFECIIFLLSKKMFELFYTKRMVDKR